MRYLVTMDGYPPFLSEYFDAENHFVAGEMIVYNLKNGKYTTNGTVWQDIKIDHL